MKIFDNLENVNKNLNDKKIKIYSCGPTVYNYIHIGNARPFIITDVLNRFLRFFSFDVDYVMNITDIDDKIINFANANNLNERNVSDKYQRAFIDDLKKLNIKLPDNLILISEKMNTIISFIESLVDKKAAYVSNGDVYFDVSKYENEYGKVSHQDIHSLKNGVRISNSANKKSHLDFALWKKTDLGIKFKSPWSDGRPGWHTECVALIDEVFNETISVHIGGLDLKFPHHDNERIQFIAKNEKELSKIWMHVGHIKLDNQKMSKSIGNIITVRDFLLDNDLNVLRYILISSSYSQPINITDDILKQSQKWNEKIFSLLKRFNWMHSISVLKKVENKNNFLNDIIESLKNDLNIPEVITIIDSIVKNMNQLLKNNEMDDSINYLKQALDILGFKFNIKEISSEDINKIKNWKILLEQKNYEAADKLRSELQDIL